MNTSKLSQQNEAKAQEIAGTNGDTYRRLRSCQGGVVFAGQLLTDPMRDRAAWNRAKLAVVNGGGGVA